MGNVSQTTIGGGETAMALVDRALDALGGEQALAAAARISLRGEEMVWEHEYSFSAMPEAEEREGSQATFVIQRDFESGAARIDWKRDIVRLKFRPYPTLYEYSEILADGTGYVDGIDTSTPTALTKLSDPPGSPMSSVRLIVTWRELTRESPRLLLDMKRDPSSVRSLGDIDVDGVAHPAVRFDVAIPGIQTEMRDWQFIVLFDGGTGLPARIRTIDGDPVQGIVDFDLVLSDWRDVDGVQVPFHRLITHNGRKLIETKYDEVTINPEFDSAIFDVPVIARAATVRANTTEAFTNVPYQWTLRRIKWGGDLNSDAVAWDATAMPEPKWVTIRPGVDWTEGVTHNSTMIVMEDYLVIWEASLHENFSEWMIRSAKRRYPGKPIKYLVLSHHHLDHNGGARPFVAEGAQIIVPEGPGYAPYYDRMFAPENPYLNDRLHRNPRKADRVVIDDKFTLDDGKRQIMFYNLKDSDHAPSLLIAYVPDTALLINTDLWNTNETLGEQPNPRQRTLFNAVERWGIKPENSVSGHGPMVPYAALAALARP
jgi:glyoxylase-like metal-dependent hydrolase (beta-lactamase superfamily II)